MSDTRAGAPCATRPRLSRPSAVGLADLLTLAAAPAFAALALATWALDGSGPDVPCGAGHAAFSSGGMTVMYAAMSVVHAAPWLKRLRARG